MTSLRLKIWVETDEQTRRECKRELTAKREETAAITEKIKTLTTGQLA